MFRLELPPVHLLVAVSLTISVALAGGWQAPEKPAPADAVIALIAWWQPGEVRYVEVVKGNREILNDTTTSEEQMRILYAVRVLEETDTSYAVRWDVLDVEDDDDSEFEISDELLARLEEEGIRIRTTELGVWVGIENVALYSEAMEEGLRASDEYMNDPEMGDEILTSVTSESVVEEFVFPELGLFYALHGYEFPIEKGWEYTELIPHHFGGSPMLAKGYSEISAFDEDEGFFTLENTLEVDSHELLQMTASLHGTEFLSEAESQRMRMSMMDKNIYRVDFFTGWTQRVERTRTTFIDWTEDGRDFALRTEQFINLRLVDSPDD